MGLDSVGLREAVALVTKFITADTSGDAQAAESYVLPLGDGVPYCELATDGYDITTSVKLTDTVANRDTVRIRATYHVLGVWWSEDAHQVGPKDARFKARPHDQVETFVVVRDSSGRLGISCDFRVPPNHPSLSGWNAQLARFDSASLAAWNSVVPVGVPNNR